MEKKLRKSPIEIVLYVLAGLALIYAIYQIGSTVSYVFSYYDQYGMSPEVGETVNYVLQGCFQPFCMAILLFAAGYILSEVRALNPAYYATDEEVAQAKAAKKLAREKAAAKVAVEKVEEAESEAVVFEAAADKIEEKLDEGKEEAEKILDEVTEEVAEENK